jgi:protocatechuate 3,4-dioxygenase, alpha subunit
VSGKPEQLGSLPSQTVGPFFHLGLTVDETLGRLWTEQAKGERIRLRFRLLDGDGAPVPDGMIELWQADASGKYSHSADTQERGADAAFRGFGRLATDAEGACMFETILPGRVADGHGGFQAPHVNVSVFARGLLSRLCTRVYFEGDPAIGEDPVLALAPGDRRQTLMARRGAAPGDWIFDIHLQGAQETVFFDV